MGKSVLRLVVALSLLGVAPTGAVGAASGIRNSVAKGFKRSAAPIPSQVGSYREGRWRMDLNGDGIFDYFSDRDYGLGFPGAQHIVADWNGDGLDEAAVYSRGFWFIDYNGDGTFDGGVEDLLFAFGWDGASPMVGDWDGDGAANVGVYSNGFWFLDFDGDRLWDGPGEDRQFPFGWEGVTPLVGDWNGDGRDEVGVYNAGFWFLDADGDTLWDGGTDDTLFGLGWDGVTLLIGDWNGDGAEQVGVYSAGSWFLDYDGDANWDGVGEDRIVMLGWTGVQPVVGDWSGDGRDKVGVYVDGAWFLDRNGSGQWEPETDLQYSFGEAGDSPIVGRWAAVTVEGEITMDPPPGSVDLARNRTIVLRFPEPVDAGSVNGETVKVVPGSGSTTPALAVSEDGRYVSAYTGYSRYETNVDIAITVEGVRTATGKVFEKFESTVTTGSDYPTGSIGLTTFPIGLVPTNATFRFSLNGAIDPASWSGAGWKIVRQIDNREFPIDCEVAEDWLSVTCEPQTPLGKGARYSLSGPPLRGLNGRESVIAQGFQAGFSADTTPPQLLFSFPESGETVSQFRELVIRFDEVVTEGPDSVVELRQGGALVPISTYSHPDGSFGIRSQAHSFAVGTNYALHVEGLQNMAGLRMEGSIDNTFAVEQGSSSPNRDWLFPSWDATDVPVNTSIYYYSATPIAPSTVDSDTVRLRGPGGLTPVEVSTDHGGRRIVMSPLADLQPGSTYLPEIEGVLTTQGAALDEAWRFETGTESDLVGLAITDSTPAHGATGVYPNAQIVIVFSEDYAPTTVNSTTTWITGSNGAHLMPSIAPSYTGAPPPNVLFLDPGDSPGLQPNVDYVLHLDGVTDLAGNRAPSTSISFRTGAAYGSRLTLLATDPPNGSENVSLQPVIELQYDQQLLAPSVNSETTYLAKPGTYGQQRTPVTVSLNGDGKSFRMTPVNPLRPNSAYEIRTAAMSLSGGTAYVPAGIQFTTGSGVADVTPPEVLDMSVGEDEVLQLYGNSLDFELTFSEAIDPESVDAESTFILVDGALLSHTFPSGFSNNGRTAHYSVGTSAIYSPLSDGVTTPHRLEILVSTNVTDLAGNGLRSEFSRRFQVLQRRGLPAESFSIQDVRPGDMTLDPNSPLTFVFTHPVSANNLQDTFYVLQNGEFVSGAFVGLAKDQVLQFRPDSNWEPGALVQAFPRQVFRAADGKELLNLLTPKSFFVSGITDGPPSVDTITYSSYLPANAIWKARLSEPVDPSTVNENTVILRRNGSATSTPGLVALIGGDTIAFTPSEPLQLDQSYSLQLTSGILDLTGDPLPSTTSNYLRIRSAVDSTAPAILAISPPANKEGVPLNAPVRVLFSEEIDRTSVRRSSLELVCDDNPQPIGTLVLGRYGNDATFELTGILPPNANCSAELSGVSDHAGNLAPHASWTFATSAEVDTRPPSQVSYSPVGGTVGTNVNLSATFDEAMDPTSINPLASNVQTGHPTTQIAGAYVLSSDAKRFSFIPDSALPVGSNISWRSNEGVRDLAGNGGSSISISFSTAFASDSTPPTVESSTPADGAMSVSPFAELSVLMDESIEPQTVTSATVRLVEGGFHLSVLPHLEYDGRTIRLYPLEPLRTDRTYTIELDGVADAAGNLILEPFEIEFTTKPSLDFTRPTATANTSWLTETAYRGVPTKIRFSEAMEPSTIRPDTIYYQAGADIVLPSTPVLDPSGTLVVLTPTEPLPAGTRVEVVVREDAVTDLAGNHFHQQVFPFASFLTNHELTDTVAPVVEWPNFLAMPNLPRNFPWGLLANLVDEPLDPWSYDGDLVTVTDANGKTVNHWTVLDAYATYTLTVQPATDLAGNALVRPQPLQVTTGGYSDNVAPTVTATEPSPNTTTDSLRPSVKVYFSEQMWFSTVGLYAHDWAPVQTTVSPDNKILTIVPTQDLRPETTYSAIIYGFDLGNNPINPSSRNYYTFTFRTPADTEPDPTDTEPPTVLSINPPDGATDVMTTDVTIEFSEPVDGTTLGEGVDFFVNGVPVSTPPLSVSPDGATLTFRHYGSYPDGAEISVSVTAEVTDMAGNAAEPAIARFTYTNRSQDSRNSINAIRPDAGAKEVDASAPIYIFFTQSVAPSSLPNAVRVSEDGVLITGQLSTSASDRVVQFTPDNPYAPGALIRVFVDFGALLNGDGSMHPDDWVYSSHFESTPGPGALPEFIWTQVSMEGSYDYGQRQPRDAQLMIDFDRPIDRTTLTDDDVTINGSVDLSLVWENGDRRLRLIPEAPLAGPATYYVGLPNTVRGTDGASLGANWHTRFAIGADLTAALPEAVSVSPPDGAENVGVNAGIQLRFSPNVNPLTINKSTVLIEGGGAGSGSCSIEHSILGDGLIVWIVPHDPFAPLEEYTVTLDGIEDTSGRALATQTFGFATGDQPDFVPPAHVNSEPEGNEAPRNAVVSATFSEPISPETVTPDDISLRCSPDYSYADAIDVQLSLSPDGRTILIEPQDLLPANNRCALNVTEVRDVSGNSNAYYSHSFMTGALTDLTAPELLSVAPGDGSVDVPINQRILFVFDSAIRPDSVNDLVRIERAGVPIPVKRLLSGPYLEIRPLALLDPTTTYTWTIATLEDLAGNAMPGSTSGSFTTGTTADLAAPVVAWTSPSDEATGVSTGATIEIAFDRAIDPRTVPEGVYLASGERLGFTASQSDDLRTLFLTPDQPLPAGSTVRVQTLGRNLDGLLGVEAQSFFFSFETAN